MHPEGSERPIAGSVAELWHDDDEGVLEACEGAGEDDRAIPGEFSCAGPYDDPLWAVPVRRRG